MASPSPEEASEGGIGQTGEAEGAYILRRHLIQILLVEHSVNGNHPEQVIRLHVICQLHPVYGGPAALILADHASDDGINLGFLKILQTEKLYS